MLLTGEAVFLNKEAKQGFKDPTKTYYNALFMDGTNTISVSVNPDLYAGTLSSIPQFTPCSLVLDYNPAWRTLTLVEISG